MLPKYSTEWIERWAAVSGFVQCVKCNAVFDRTCTRLTVNIDYEWPEPGFNWCRLCKRKYPATQLCKTISVRHFNGKCPGCGVETTIHLFSPRRSNAYCAKCESFYVIFKPDKRHPICDGRAAYARRELSSYAAYRGRFQQSAHGKMISSENPEEKALEKLMPTTREGVTDNSSKITTPTMREARWNLLRLARSDQWSISYSSRERKQREFERFVERDIEQALGNLELNGVVRERTKNLCLKLYYTNRRGKPWAYCLAAVVFHAAQESKEFLHPEEVWSRMGFKRRFNIQSFLKILEWTLEILDVTQYTLDNWDGSKDKSAKALVRRYMVILDAEKI